MYHGIINVKKEAGFTSHDVVAKLRGILHQKKIGHTGTLDPDATGVLPVCLGKATKLCDLIGDWDKTYEAVLLLGQETDTEDTSGEVIKRSEVTVTEEQIRQIIESFVGDYEQIPPMYSAKKVGGKKLYELAREGRVIERKPCHVSIQEIRILDISLPEVRFEVSCSKGTYIRSLCRDIGEKAGCGGCMSHLVRTRVAMYHIEEAYLLSEIETLRDEEKVESILTPIDAVFGDYISVTAPDHLNKLLYNGNKLPFKACRCAQREEISHSAHPDSVRLYDAKGEFIGIYELTEGRKILKPVKLFL